MSLPKGPAQAILAFGYSNEMNVVVHQNITRKMETVEPAVFAD